MRSWGACSCGVGGRSEGRATQDEGGAAGEGLRKRAWEKERQHHRSTSGVQEEQPANQNIEPQSGIRDTNVNRTHQIHAHRVAATLEGRV